MADTAEVVAHALTIPGLRVAALVPNLRGADAAFAAGVRKIGFPRRGSDTQYRHRAIHCRGGARRGIDIRN